jgi:beta-1,4-mannosyl-glycoprotein beta-1,4-N-acetylglucosaminyltransferase
LFKNKNKNKNMNDSTKEINPKDKIKVYDCFVFYNEMDLLEVRLNELNDVVDYFVLVEGEKTFQYQDKILFYDENKDNENLVKFKDKIIHLKVPSSDFTSDSWVNEAMSFNYIRHGLINANENDIIILSALDEIPKPSTLNRLKDGSLNSPKFLWQNVYFYFFNTRFKHGQIDWIGSVVLPKFCLGWDIYQAFDQRHKLYQFLNTASKPESVVADGGWHFSFVGDSKFIIDKLNTFAHTEHKHLSEHDIQSFIDGLTDPLGRNTVSSFYGYERIENLPLYIQQNTQKFKKYFHQSV